MASLHPIAEPCSRCKSPREWRSSKAGAEPGSTIHLYVCTSEACATVSVLILKTDGSRVWRSSRNRWRDVIS